MSACRGATRAMVTDELLGRCSIAHTSEGGEAASGVRARPSDAHIGATSPSGACAFAEIHEYAPDLAMVPSLKTGDVIAGKYLLERIVGRGGVGVVVAAQHMMLRKRVALKFLRPELANEPEVIGRFVREAQAAAQIRGEHVARVLDADTLETGAAFLVMEYLEGKDLATVLRDDGPLPVDFAVDCILQACDGIAEAHALGIVHRDIKPANLFLTRSPDGSPFVKVLDFGLSKVLRRDSFGALTADHHVIGSPHFMSPEQMRSSRDVDVRTDVWALGAVLYTLLTGHVPFDGSFLTEICSAILTGEMRGLRELRPDVPEGLEEVVGACLRLEPAERYASLAELARALTPFAPERTAEFGPRIERLLEATPPALLPLAPPSSRRELSLRTPSLLSNDFRSLSDIASLSTVAASPAGACATGDRLASDRPPWARSSTSMAASDSSSEVMPSEPRDAGGSLAASVSAPSRATSRFALGGAAVAIAGSMLLWGALREGADSRRDSSPASQDAPLATEIVTITPPATTRAPTEGSSEGPTPSEPTPAARSSEEPTAPEPAPTVRSLEGPTPTKPTPLVQTPSIPSAPTRTKGAAESTTKNAPTRPSLPLPAGTRGMSDEDLIKRLPH